MGLLLKGDQDRPRWRAFTAAASHCVPSTNTRLVLSPAGSDDDDDDDNFRTFCCCV